MKNHEEQVHVDSSTLPEDLRKLAQRANGGELPATAPIEYIEMLQVWRNLEEQIAIVRKLIEHLLSILGGTEEIDRSLKELIALRP